MHLTILIPAIVLASLPYSFSLNCYPPPEGGQLPIMDSCHDLVTALMYASRLPYLNDPIQWSRNLPSDEGRHTEKLPKLYWLAGRGPQTCALNLDADPGHLDATETFRLRAIGIAAARIVDICLGNRRQIGRDHLGPTGRVIAKIERSDRPGLLQIARGEGVGGLRIPGIGELLWTDGMGNGTRDEVRR